MLALALVAEGLGLLVALRMSDPHDRPFIYLLVSGAIFLIVAIVYGTYLQIRDNKRKRERREQRRDDKKKGKRPSR